MAAACGEDEGTGSAHPRGQQRTNGGHAVWGEAAADFVDHRLSGQVAIDRVCWSSSTGVVSLQEAVGEWRCDIYRRASARFIHVFHR